MYLYEGIKAEIAIERIGPKLILFFDFILH